MQILLTGFLVELLTTADNWAKSFQLSRPSVTAAAQTLTVLSEATTVFCLWAEEEEEESVNYFQQSYPVSL